MKSLRTSLATTKKQNKNKKTSALTYGLYCFKHLKITLLWQTPTIE